MAITIDIDEKGQRVEKIGGIVMHRDNFNTYCAGEAVCHDLFLSYAAGNFQVVRMKGRYKDGTLFEAESTPSDPVIPLATVIQQMADTLLKQKRDSNAVANG